MFRIVLCPGLSHVFVSQKFLLVSPEANLTSLGALTLCLSRDVQDGALPRLELFVRRSKLSPCFPRGESYQFGAVNPGIVLQLLIGLKTVSYFRRISQRRSRRKAGLVLLQFWHGQLGSSGGFRRKPIHSKCTGASSRKLRSDSAWVSALWRLPGDTMKS